MLIKRNPGWRIPESQATPESVYVNRRRLLQAMGLGAGLLATAGAALSLRPARAADPDPTTDLYPAKHNGRYTLDRPLTPRRTSPPTTTSTNTAPTRTSGRRRRS